MRWEDSIIGTRLYINAKLPKCKWIISKYDDDYWLFYIDNKNLYYVDLEDFKSLKEAQTFIISKEYNQESIVGLDIIGDIRDSEREKFYRVSTLKSILNKL